MRIGILGAGAMGSLFGGLLSASGEDVTLLTRSDAHVKAVTQHGLQIVKLDGDNRRIDMGATTTPSKIENIDLMMVFTKCYDTDEAMATVSHLLSDDIYVLTLQNGLGNPETIAKYVNRETVLAGTTAHGAIFEAPGKIRHTGEGPTAVGNYFTENANIVNRVTNILSNAGIPTTAVESVRDVVWEKVLINVGINAATALARVPNGAMTARKPGRSILELSIQEGKAIAEAEGRSIPSDIIEQAEDVAAQTAENHSSMRQDIERGTQTEIDYLNGAIVKRAEKHGIDVPVNRVLTALVHLAEGSQN